MRAPENSSARPALPQIPCSTSAMLRVQRGASSARIVRPSDVAHASSRALHRYRVQSTPACTRSHRARTGALIFNASDALDDTRSSERLCARSREILFVVYASETSDPSCTADLARHVTCTAHASRSTRRVLNVRDRQRVLQTSSKREKRTGIAHSFSVDFAAAAWRTISEQFYSLTMNRKDDKDPVQGYAVLPRVQL